MEHKEAISLKSLLIKALFSLPHGKDWLVQYHAILLPLLSPSRLHRLLLPARDYLFLSSSVLLAHTSWHFSQTYTDSQLVPVWSIQLQRAPASAIQRCWRSLRLRLHQYFSIPIKLRYFYLRLSQLNFTQSLCITLKVKRAREEEGLSRNKSYPAMTIRRGGYTVLCGNYVAQVLQHWSKQK